MDLAPVPGGSILNPSASNSLTSQRFVFIAKTLSVHCTLLSPGSKMKVSDFLPLLLVFSTSLCDTNSRQPLTYAPVPDGTYIPPKNSSITTLLDFVQSRSDLSVLAGILGECGGMFSSSSRTEESAHCRDRLSGSI